MAESWLYDVVTYQMSLCFWSNMNNRVKKQPAYKGVEIRFTKQEFIDWMVPELQKWIRSRPDEQPSVDRIDPYGHYEFGNIRLMELNWNRRNNRRYQNNDSPQECFWCPDCSQYLPREDFYERPSVPLTATRVRNHWSAKCKECTKEAKKKLRPIPSGECERCHRPLKSTESGAVSRAKHCDSCRQILWQKAHPEQAREISNRTSTERSRRYRERHKK